MSERISRSDSDGGTASGLQRVDRLHGAALGTVGLLITLALGGAVMFGIRFLLTLGPSGGEVEQRVLVYLWRFAYGMWLIVPLAITGAMLGYDRMLLFFSYFWFTAEPKRRALSIVLWTALAVVCKITELLVSRIF
ncbi:MAG: hypothetical protein JNN20_06540 [Betaproteobacteria bacterium]|nr:hypothetical protein [Betaproteobacteria bacterium]